MKSDASSSSGTTPEGSVPMENRISFLNSTLSRECGFEMSPMMTFSETRKTSKASVTLRKMKNPKILLSPKNEKSIASLDKGDFHDDQDQTGYDLLSPVGSDSTHSLFPVLPTFDCPQEETMWHNSTKAKDITKMSILKEPPESWDHLLAPPEHAQIIGMTQEDSAFKPDAAGKATPMTQMTASLQPPPMRRYVSVPKIQLQFDEQQKEAMNNEIDAAIHGARAPLSQSSELPTVGGKRTRTSKSEGKGFACSSCRISKTKCEGGFPCYRCERLDRECKREERPVKRMRKEDPHDESCRSFAKKILDSYLTSPEDFASVERDGKAEHCYRNKWCIRPYRHPGHCKHSNLRKKSRSKGRKLRDADDSE